MIIPILLLSVLSLAALAIILTALARCRHCGQWHLDHVEAWFCARAHTRSGAADEVFNATLTRPAATLSHPMGEGDNLRAADSPAAGITAMATVSHAVNFKPASPAAIEKQPLPNPTAARC